MDFFNHFEYDLDNAITKLRLSNDNIKAQAFGILNGDYRSMETDEVKANYINDILRQDLTFLKLKDIINLIKFAYKIEFTTELYDKIRFEKDEEEPIERWGVHITHCCSKHGCKYGNSKCPVATGKVEQEYPCEYCRDDER
jgi:hypothetical protein